MKNILITGGTGFIGVRLASKLRFYGYDLSVVTRNPAKAPNRSKAELIHIDEPLGPHVEGKYAVINLAGAPIAGKKWTKKYKETIIKSRVDITKRLAEAIKAAKKPPQVFFSASAVGYYGDNKQTEANEAAEPGEGFLAEVCKQWEDAAKPAEKATRLVIGRIGVVFDREEGALAKMIKPYRYFIGGPLGNGRQWVPWIHIDDLTEMIKYTINNKKIKGPVNLTSTEPVRMKELASKIGKYMNRPSFFPVPPFVLRLLMGEMAVIVLGGQRAVQTKASEAGYEYIFADLDTALARIFKPFDL